MKHFYGQNVQFRRFYNKPFSQIAPNFSVEEKVWQWKNFHIISSLKKNLNKNREPSALFIDSSAGEKETVLSISEKRLLPELAIKQESELQTLPPVKLLRFNGKPLHMPKFIDNIYNRVHKKTSLNNCFKNRPFIQRFRRGSKKDNQYCRRK